MAASRTSSGRRKASWIGFCVVVLATLSVGKSASDVTSTGTAVQALSLTETDAAAPSLSLDVASGSKDAETTGVPEYDAMADANKAYGQALQALASISTYQPLHTPGVSDAQPNTIFTTLFPNQQGPIASLIRIIYKLRQQSWVPRFLSASLGRDSWSAGRKKEEMQGKAVKVVDLLEHAAELGHMDALYKLGHVSLFHLSPLLHNVSRAFEAYSTHAVLTGNSTSQSILAFFFATGYNGVVDVDQAKALLYYTFAALGGDQGAQMALGYRHWAGIGVNDDCAHALEWYQMAAEQSMAKFMSGPPGGRTLPQTTTRLSDLEGGAYGPGASVASTGMNAHRAVIKAASAQQAGETWEDVLEYYMFNADRGEIDFAYRLGKIFYQGSIYALPGGAASGGEGVGAIPRDYGRARGYFLRIARQIWPRETPGAPTPPPKQEQKDDGTVSYAAASAGFLGRMYLRGEGVRQDASIAKMWFERGAEYGEKECNNGLGIIWRDGLVDGKRDLKKAHVYFNIAAHQELAEAQVNLGKYQYQKGDIKLATTYFESAIRHGSPFEPYYYLAEIYATSAQNPASPPHHIQGSCAMAVSFYKLVAERGTWMDDPVREGEARWKLGTERTREDAMLRWWIASERGVETAQNNLAYILDQDRSVLRLTRFAPATPSNDTARLALTQWMRSAYQRNVDALVKVGDYYYHGLGVPDGPEEVRWERAVAFYQSAVDTQVSALAMWNLGWMYENGIGVPQDFHLAKRHYDMALETNSEAYLPVMLSLVKLHVRSIWHTVMGGKNGLSIWPEEVPDESHKETQTLDGGQEQADDDDEIPVQQVDEEYLEGADDTQWYKGKAKDDLKKRLRASGQRLRTEDDPIQWARERRNAENERDGDFGPEDFFDSAMHGPGRRGDEGGAVAADDFAETMLLAALCLAVSALMYVRGRWFERRRREEEERARAAAGGAPPPPPPPNAANAGGAFPPPGDPARDAWAVLR
ncbi:hypothetical protein M0805_009098 [Coniferiporia weirii]|nr:hypothetical protein M0805_009098 [Coniferiporia weirii]